MTAVLLPTPVPRHMSYSQSTTLADCGLKYFLERVVRAPYAPNMAAVGGKATHLATEWIDWFHDAADYFESDLTRHYGAVLRWDQTEAPPGSDPGGLEAKVGIRADNTRTATTIAYLDGVDTVESGEWVAKETVPGSVRDLWDIALSESIAEESSRAAEQYQDPTTWRVFGKATKAWPNKEDRDWWDHHGPIFIMRWLHWRLTSGFKMVFLDGDPSQPAIEVDCSGTLGGVEIKGFIDRIMLDPWGQPSPLDIKGLDVRTPLATPSGWTTMGEVQVGDQVFGANGHPVTVTAKSEVKMLPCYRVKFDDGTDIVCDEEHLWETTTGRSKHGVTSVKGIKQIASRLTNPEGGKDHRVRMPEPVQLAEQDLPIDPYLLGVWLGDGAAQAGKFTKPAECRVHEMLQARGHDVYQATCPSLEGKCPLWMVRGLTRHLRELGVQNNKHVPPAYLRGSVRQRLDLLRGLMDSDGTWNKKRKQVTFNSVDKALASAVRELALSLGERASIFEYTAKGYGKVVTAYAVSWGVRYFVPFLAPPKADRVIFASPTGKGSRRLILSVEEVPSTPTVCIAVDADDHLYLAGEQMVPTHNTNSKLPDVSRQLGLYRLLLEEMGFPPPAKGYAWWARSGELGPETDLTVPDLSEARMVYDLRTLRDRRNNGDFQPNTQSISCSYCGVKPFCYARDGERSNEATRPWEVSRIEIK